MVRDLDALHLHQQLKEPAHLAPAPLPPLSQEALRDEELTSLEFHDLPLRVAATVPPRRHLDQVLPRLPPAEHARLEPERVRLERLAAHLHVAVVALHHAASFRCLSSITSANSGCRWIRSRA